MKIEEARRKTCIHMRLNPERTGIFLCVGTDCMAWRWFDTATKNEGYCGLAGKEGAE